MNFHAAGGMHAFSSPYQPILAGMVLRDGGLGLRGPCMVGGM